MSLPKQPINDNQPLFQVGTYVKVSPAFRTLYLPQGTPPDWFGRVVFAARRRCDDQWWYSLEDPRDPLDPEDCGTEVYVNSCLSLPEHCLEVCTPAVPMINSHFIGVPHDSALPYRPWIGSEPNSDPEQSGDLCDALLRWRRLKFYQINDFINGPTLPFPH